jgi:hypothetical protein
MFFNRGGETRSQRAARLDLERRVTEVHKQAGEGFMAVGPRSRSPLNAERKSAFTGDGFDFYQPTEYDPEVHDARKIMWAKSASLADDDMLLARVTRPETQITVYAGIDLSRTHDFGSSRESKLWLMARSVATMCYSLKGTQDLILPLMYANNSVERLTPKSVSPLNISRRLVADILEPPYSDGSQDSGMIQMLNSIPRRGRCEIVLFSDFLNMTPEQQELLRRVARRNSVRACVIQDDRERHLPESPVWWPFPSPLRVFDLTSGKQYVWWTTQGNRDKYTAAFNAHEKRLKEFFKSAGIQHQFVNTNEGHKATYKVIELLAFPPMLR